MFVRFCSQTHLLHIALTISAAAARFITEHFRVPSRRILVANILKYYYIRLVGRLVYHAYDHSMSSWIRVFAGQTCVNVWHIQTHNVVRPDTPHVMDVKIHMYIYYNNSTCGPSVCCRKDTIYYDISRKLIRNKYDRFAMVQTTELHPLWRTILASVDRPTGQCKTMMMMVMAGCFAEGCGNWTQLRCRCAAWSIDDWDGSSARRIRRTDKLMNDLCATIRKMCVVADDDEDDDLEIYMVGFAHLWRTEKSVYNFGCILHKSSS